MANVIERVLITGFWGDKTVEMKFRSSRNFIIGVNGSGKTTFIDLLSAALRMDFETLSRIDFDEIKIVLKTLGKNQKPVIRLKKIFINEYLAQITYFLKPSTSANVTEYEFDDFADIRMARRRRMTPRNEAQHLVSSNSCLSWLSFRGCQSGGRIILPLETSPRTVFFHQSTQSWRKSQRTSPHIFHCCRRRRSRRLISFKRKYFYR